MPADRSTSFAIFSYIVKPGSSASARTAGAGAAARAAIAASAKTASRRFMGRLLRADGRAKDTPGGDGGKSSVSGPGHGPDRADALPRLGRGHERPEPGLGVALAARHAGGPLEDERARPVGQ